MTYPETPELAFEEVLKWVKQGRTNVEKKLGLPPGSTGHDEKPDEATERILKFMENNPNPGQMPDEFYVK